MTVRVYMRHVRSAGICARGTRGFFKDHGLDHPRFLLEGISSEALLATGDPFAKQAVEVAEREASNGQ